MRRCAASRLLRGPFRLPCALLVSGAAYCRSSLSACAFTGWGPSQLKAGAILHHIFHHFPPLRCMLLPHGRLTLAAPWPLLPQRPPAASHGRAAAPYRHYGAAAVVAMAAVTRRARKVAVVGGGPAGLAACRFLEKFGHQPTVFEISSEVGGIWAPEPANDVVYKGLVTNIPTMCMQSFDLDFPSGLNSYITAPQLGDYMIQYVDHFNLRRFFRFQTRVESVALDGEAWRVTSRAVSTDEPLESESFDAVCVANGHYEFPYLPEIPGETAWLAAERSGSSDGEGRRRVVHAVHYDDPEEFRNQSVLIVGGRSSAVDVARELKSRTRCLYVLESGCQDITREDHCCRIPMGSSLNPDGTLSYDGQQIAGEAVDTVILATGYTYRYPFLDEEGLGLDFGPMRRYVAPLYQHVIHAKHDSLCFMGVPLAVPCPLPLFEAGW
eukprot:s2825_g2.t1